MKKQKNLRKQSGVSIITIMVVLIVGAIILLGGTNSLKYIESSKVANDLDELNDLRASTISYGNNRGGNFTGVSLATLAGLEFFPAARVTGTGASTAVTNQWKGNVTVAAATVINTNDAIAYTYTGVPSSACKKLGMDAARIVNLIRVGSTTVKATTTGAVNEANLTTACDAANDNASITYTIASR